MTTLKGHPDVPAGTALNVRLIWDVPLQGAGRGLSPKHRDATYDWSTGKYMDGQTELTFPHPRAGQNDNALRGPLVAVYTIGTGPLSQTARYPLQAYETAPGELDITVDPNPATVVAAQTLIDLITGADVARTQAEEAAQRVNDAILDLSAERQAVADIIADTAQQQAENDALTTTNIAAMNAASGAVIAELRNTDALGKLATQAAGGALSASTTAPTFTRASVALHPALGVDVPADQARTVTRGGKLFAYLDRASAATATNLFANPYAPATQLVTVVSGTTYTVTARGGTVALYGAATASISGGRSVTFKATSAQLGVVVGSGVTHVQVEAATTATSRIPAAGRARENLGAVRRVGTFPRLQSVLFKLDAIDAATSNVLLEVVDEAPTPVRVFALVNIGGALGTRGPSVDGITTLSARQFGVLDLNWTSATTFDLYLNGALVRSALTSTSDLTGLRVGASLATATPGNNYPGGEWAYEEYGGTWTAAQIAARFSSLSASRAADVATGERYPVNAGDRMIADVVIIGCHAAGLGSAVRLGQLGYSVVMTCEETVAGGMLTAGQIGFVDGTPNLYWPERPGTAAGSSNGDLVPQTSWSTTGGVWKEFRERISPTRNPVNIPATYRYLAGTAKTAVNQWLRSLPTVTVLYRTKATSAALAAGVSGKRSVTGVHVAGPQFTGTLIGQYYVDGSDAGQLVGLLGLPYRTGITAADGYAVTGKTEFGVMDYAYRTTMISNDSGLIPSSAPLYYSVFLPNYRGTTAERWPTYKSQFGIADGDAAFVHPIRVFNNQGRLSGNNGDSIIDNATGYPAGSTVQLWDVNGAMNSLSSLNLARALRTNADVAALFTRYGITNPYGPTDADIYYKWANIVWIEDSSPLSAKDKVWLVDRIKEATKAASLGLLWYIRSGDMQTYLRTLSGSSNVQVMSNWSVSNQLTTVDGLPEMIYQREGRRIQSEYTATANAGDTDGWMSIYALSPTYDVDKLRGDHTSQSSPADFADAVVINDYPVDIHGTSGGPPESYVLPRVHQLPLRTLIPKNTTGLLVGSAIGTDRRAFASKRLDPVRLMTGGAIAEAINLSMQTGNRDFTQLDTVALRDALARQYQGTRYAKDTHTWDTATSSWLRLDVSRAIQRLHARGWLNTTWIGSQTGLQTPLPTAALTGAVGQALATAVATRGGPASNTVPWLIDGSATVTSLATVSGVAGLAGDATVGDAYVWYAGKLP
ncbi:hypothetical protein GCM10017784_11120 [Deinococcus indicus]|uniref:FAD-dependent oxidoreductase n=1 Tax=Deinococcus indicus TaxID=223556 RepID=UPI00174D00AB|nr:FAD-dependent oxidoreductase [Deinococcus indicus]GHG21413.1 hypothetical protein GCM10017784_11120 [Deinococcus indicus]